MRTQLLIDVLALVAVAGSLVHSVHGKPLDEILEEGTIRVGIHPHMPKMSAPDGAGGWIGFDIDVGRAVAMELGVEVEWVPVEPGRQTLFLSDDRIDIALGGLKRNTELAKVIDFTLPLHTEVFAVLATGDIRGTRWQDFNRHDVILANQAGNPAVKWIGEHLPQARRETAHSIAEVIRLVEEGRAHAAVENVDFVHSYTRDYADVNWRMVEEPVAVHYCAIGVGQGNHNLTEVLNIIVHGLHRSGLIAEFWERHYGAPMVHPVEPNPYF